MGYSTDSRGIKSFQPDDDEKTLYLASEMLVTGEDFKRAIIEKWGEQAWMDGSYNVAAEHIHTDCLGYDRYDPFDYTNFIVVRLNP